jgi:hypoxanthine phosphoribosyltransferase
VTITILCLLKGAFRFARDLTKEFDRMENTLVKPYEVEFVRVKSYVNESSGDVSITGLDLSVLVGRHVLILDDLVDSGKSMKTLMD